MTIELEQEFETELARQAEKQGKTPEAFAAELLRSTLVSVPNGAPDGACSDENDWLLDLNGNRIGFDGMTWRQIAHLGHKY